MRFSVFLSAAVLSFLFLLPQQGFSQQMTWPPPASEPMPANGMLLQGQQELLQVRQEYERAGYYLADLHQLYNAAKRRGDKSEYRRLKDEIKQFQKIVKFWEKKHRDMEKGLGWDVKLGQFDYLCAMNQNPGMCRKCENGRVVVDNSQNPGSCMKCENGQAVYNNSYLSSCRRCLNGKVVALNGKTCKASTKCKVYTCQQGRCVGDDIIPPSPYQCFAAN